MDNAILLRNEPFDDGRSFAGGEVGLPSARGGGCLSGLLQLMGAAPGEAGIEADMPVLVRRRHAGDALFHQGARVEAIYFVHVGTFKLFHTAEDGYEQVLGFTGRAEVLGLDAIGMKCYPTTAVALEDASVYAVLVPEFFALAQRIPALGRMVLLAAGRALARQGELADLMAAVASEVRLARFLVQLSQQMAVRGQSSSHFHLHMSRRDIGSYLGVAHETVSRSFTVLAHWGYLQVDKREVKLLDMDGLKAFARSTRRPPLNLDAATGRTDSPAASAESLLDGDQWQGQRLQACVSPVARPGRLHG